MSRFKTYLQEFRFQQWIKNVVVFLPAFFGSRFFEPVELLQGSIAFAMFSMSASLVYLINDYRDIPEDRKHPEKRNRPLASGKISKTEAIFLAVLLLLLITSGLFWISSKVFTIIIVSYLLLNILYSFGFKKIPFAEIIIVAVFYVLRLAGGGELTNIPISIWLYLIIFCGSFLFVSGKRLTEKRNSNTRFVLKYYSQKSLNLLVLSSAILSIVFIFLYALNQGVLYLPQWLIFSSAIARYIKLLNKTKLGESIGIIFDKVMLLLIAIFSVYTILIIYFI